MITCPVSLRRRLALPAAAGALLAGTLAHGQTVTVSQSGPADYTSIQAAIDALAPGGAMDDSVLTNNVVQILDDSLYQEALRVDGFGITIESTGPDRPRLTASAADAAIIPNNFHMRFDSDQLCVLRGLIIMPATGSQPDGCITFDDFANAPGQAYDVLLEDVLIAANDGTDQPISTSGTVPPDGTEIRYGDNVLDFNSTPAGSSPSITLRRTVITGASRGFGDLVRFFVDGAQVSIEEGCRFTYSADHGLYFSGAEGTTATYAGTPADPVIIHGCEGAAVFSNSALTRAVASMDYVAVTRNSSAEEDTAIICLYDGGSANTWTNVTFAGNTAEQGNLPSDGLFSVSAPLVLENAILAGDGGEGTTSPRNLGEVLNGAAVTADGVCIDTSHGPTSLNVMYQRELAEAEDGILGADPVPAGAGITGLSPDLITLDPADPNYLRVTNAAFEILGPGGGALTGAGTFSPLPFTGIRKEVGDFQNFIEGIPVPSASSTDKYSQPDADELLIFSAAVHNVLEGELQAASDLAALVNYDAIFYEDTVSSTWFLALTEDTPGAGGWRGFYWFDLSPDRQAVMQSPHPLFDGTRLQGIDLALRTESVALFQAGTHRNNSPEISPCDGTQSSGDPYLLSDMAHNGESYFQLAHKMLHNYYEDTVSVSVHGMAETSDPSDVVISNGTGTQVFGPSLSRSIADLMNVLLDMDPRYAVSHQEPGENPALSGSTNTQGRYCNGSADPCEEPGLVLSPERFIHMEQDPDVRNSPASNWLFVIDTYNSLIPPFPPTFVAPQEDGSLVSEFLLNGDAVPSVAPRDGILQGAATPAPNRFSTADSAIQVTDSGHLLVPRYDYDGSDTEFTLSFWFRANSAGSGGFQYLFSHGSIGRSGEVTLPDSLHIYLERDTGEIRVRHTVADGTPWLFSGPQNLNDDAWHFIALTYSQVGGTTLYVDGAPVGDLPDTALNTFDPEGAMVLGGRSDLSAGRFLAGNPGETGYLDTFRIHNTALPPSEIAALNLETEGGSRVDGWLILGE